MEKSKGWYELLNPLAICLCIICNNNLKLFIYLLLTKSVSGGPKDVLRGMMYYNFKKNTIFLNDNMKVTSLPLVGIYIGKYYKL